MTTKVRKRPSQRRSKPSIDPIRDRAKLVLLRDSGDLFQPQNPSVRTIHRYHYEGLRGVKLEAVLFCGLLYTTQEAVDQFLRNVANTAFCA